jgi:hypothetical protein
MLEDLVLDVKGKPFAHDGNSTLKPSKVSLPYTQAHVEEIMKCKDDWKYFAQEYYHITSLDEGIIKVKTRKYQDSIINNFIQNRFNILLASRQCGKSTSYEIFCLHYVLFNESKKVAILANKLETAVGILSKIKLAYELLPKYIQQGVKKWNERSIELENGCSIIASATSSSAIRSKAVNVLILDEMAFVPNKQWSKFYSSVYPTISSSKDSKIIIVSTPNGLNQFYKFWTEALKGVDGVAGRGNKFVPSRVDWWEVPGRDQKWKEETIANTSEREFACEYGNDFLGSSFTLIGSEFLNNLTDCQAKPLTLQLDDKYKPFVKVYDLPEAGHTYALGLDSSEMMEDSVGDSISLQVLDVTKLPFVQVASCNIREGITYFEVPEIAVALGNYYNEAMMFIESNSTGLEIANTIIAEFEYENVYSEKTLPGIKTTKKTKRLGCSNLKMLIEGHHLILKDYETISQLTTFVKKKTSYAADTGYLDDAVMSLIVSLYFMNDMKAIDFTTDINFTKNTFKKLEEDIEETSNILVSGIMDFDDDATGEEMDWSWLSSRG